MYHCVPVPSSGTIPEISNEIVKADFRLLRTIGDSDILDMLEYTRESGYIYA